MSFHEVRFPTDISLASEGGPERRTEIVVLGSGHEERNTRWADSRRRYDAGYGIKSLDNLHSVLSFFEERRGRLYGFRWKDYSDYKSCVPSQTPAQTDQTIGTGDGTTATFQLTKTYGSTFAPYTRNIKKPVASSVIIAVDSVSQTQDTDFTLDTTTGIVTFLPGAIPAVGETITAGFEFDVPVRFDADRMAIDILKFQSGTIQNIPIVEVRI
ncbi:MAG: DUF2460 domain-containing protein [Pseudomonadota bacterium]